MSALEVIPHLVADKLLVWFGNDPVCPEEAGSFVAAYRFLYYNYNNNNNDNNDNNNNNNNNDNNNNNKKI